MLSKPKVASLFLTAVDGPFCCELSSLVLHPCYSFQPSPPPLPMNPAAAHGLRKGAVLPLHMLSNHFTGFSWVFCYTKQWFIILRARATYQSWLYVCLWYLIWKIISFFPCSGGSQAENKPVASLRQNWQCRNQSWDIHLESYQTGTLYVLTAAKGFK